MDNTPDAQARNRFESRLENSEIGTGGFKTVVFPESPADLPDKVSKPQLAVMHMDTAPVSDGGSEIPEKIQTLYQKSASKHGGETQSRVYKNYVLFLAPECHKSKVQSTRHVSWKPSRHSSTIPNRQPTSPTSRSKSSVSAVTRRT